MHAGGADLVQPEGAVGQPHAQQPQVLVQVCCRGGGSRLPKQVPLQQLPVPPCTASGGFADPLRSPGGFEIPCTKPGGWRPPARRLGDQGCQYAGRQLRAATVHMLQGLLSWLHNWPRHLQDRLQTEQVPACRARELAFCSCAAMRSSCRSTPRITRSRINGWPSLTASQVSRKVPATVVPGNGSICFVREQEHTLPA